MTSQVNPEYIELKIPGAEPVPLRMRLIPAGTFMMGSPEDEEGRDYKENPQHKVTITKPFYMGIHPVTQAQWMTVMGTNPSEFRSSKDNPVEKVSWQNCNWFILKLNRMGIGTFRLPTEAEWEYACRAGSASAYPWGNDIRLLDLYAWYAGNSDGRTHPVGRKEPNEWVLYDMLGNVWEWCSDWFDSYSIGSQTDPAGPEGGSCRVLRGGGWTSIPQYCRSTNRYDFTPTSALSSLGFRLERTP